MGILDPEEELRKARAAARDSLRRLGKEPKEMPQAADELSPPGSSLKIPGGWDLAKGKRKRKKRPLEGLA